MIQRQVKAMIKLSKDSFETNLGVFVDKLFTHPEIKCIKIKELEICRDNKNDTIKSAVNKSYHDAYSDIDLCAVVELSAESKIMPDVYIKNIEHWGFPLEMIFGVCFVPENQLCRFVCKNGMRYDLKFAFEFQDDVPTITLKPIRQQNSNSNWPIENIYQFWFVQIQALGKLYRNDFLISSHLANSNINETFVQQMVLRDLKYHTNHHRYGDKEELIYLKYTGQCPYQTENIVFNKIADKLYSAALAYDELVTFFYPDYEPRSKNFFAIWKSYEEHRNNCFIEEEKKLLISIIGTLEAIKEGGLSITEAEKLLFSPYIVRQLKKRKYNESVINLVEKGCELEDIASLLPQRLIENIEELKQEAIEEIKMLFL